MSRKYELVKDNHVNISINNGRVLILYRIRALRDFSDVKKGDLGGFVEKEDNLSQCGNCWLYDDAKVYDNAKVYDSAKIFNNARVFGDAKISGHARVFGDAQVCNNAKIYNNAKVYGDSVVCDNVEICGIVTVFGDAQICENAKIYSNAKVHGDSIVCGIANISSNADITSSNDYYTSLLYMDDTSAATFYKSTNGNILVSYKFYNELIEEFEKLLSIICADNEVYIFQAKTVLDFAKRKLSSNINSTLKNIKFNSITDYTSDTVLKEVKKMNMKSGYNMPNSESMNIIENISIKKGCSDNISPINHCPYNVKSYYDTDDALASFAASNSERKKLITSSIYGIFKKYELLKDRNYTINFDGRTLYRIRALRDFGDVKKGDLGGYIENEYNLSHNGRCWIYGDAKVFGNARVSDNAWVSDNACVSGDACVYDNARVFDNAWVYGDSQVYGDACVYDNAKVYGKASTCGDANIYSNSVVHGDVTINGDTSIGIDGYIKNKNDYYNVPYTTDDGITRTMTIYKTKSDNMMVSILDIFNCSVERLISNGINYKTTKSDKPKLEYHDKVGDDDVIVYKDENNIMMVKSKLFSGSFDVFKRIIFNTTSTIYGAKSQYISNTETIKTMFKYREVLKNAIKYFRDNDK